MKRVITATVLALVSTGAQAQGCGPYEEIAKYLAKEHGESVIASGTTPRDALVEFWGNPETGSWSLIARPKPDVGCPLMSGENLKAGSPAVPGRDS